MLRRPKHSKIEVVAPKEEEEEVGFIQSFPLFTGLTNKL
jgi:hypothetical protein